MEISHFLQSWYSLHQRQLPWRETHDAYLIWLSEIILQQTRVAQGFDYYTRFTQRFPTVADLAMATEDEVLKLWQGLGYYSRARNLHKAARMVHEEMHDLFPTRFADLIRLPGVGHYTAAAIASFSSNEAVAVVDGNVYRVLARLFDIDTPIDSTQGQHTFQALADDLLDRHHPGAHNQAIMEFGALHCTPTSPQCDICPLMERCAALANHTVTERPVKRGKTKVRDRYFRYTLYKYNNEVWVHQRGAGDIWQGLWEFYLEEIEETEAKQEGNTSALSLTHLLTHQRLHLSFRVVDLTKPSLNLPEGYLRLPWEEWLTKAQPKPLVQASEHFDRMFDQP